MGRKEDLNKCYSVVKYNGMLADVRLRPMLLALLLDLSAHYHYPDAMILAQSEHDWFHVHVRDDINCLRSEFSYYLLNRLFLKP